MGRIDILASYEFHIIRVYKNLVQHPSNNISIAITDKMPTAVYKTPPTNFKMICHLEEKSFYFQVVCLYNRFIV